MRFPPFPEVPEPLRGNAFALVEAVSRRRARGRRRPPRSAPRARTGDGHVPRHACARARARCTWTRRTRSPASATGSCSARPTPRRSPHSSSRRAPSRAPRSSRVELRQLGGALDRAAEGDGAASFAGCEFAVFAVGIAATPELHAASERDSKRVVEALERWDAGRDYMNFRETRSSGERLFSPEVHERLRAIKRRVDPRDLIRSNHPVAAGYGFQFLRLKNAW